MTAREVMKVRAAEVQPGDYVQSLDATVEFVGVKDNAPHGRVQITFKNTGELRPVLLVHEHDVIEIERPCPPIEIGHQDWVVFTHAFADLAQIGPNGLPDKVVRFLDASADLIKVVGRP